MQQVTLHAALGALALRPLFFACRLSDRDAAGKYHTKLALLTLAGDSPHAAYARCDGTLKPLHDVTLPAPSADGSTVYAYGIFIAAPENIWCLDVDGSDPTISGSTAAAAWQHASSTGAMFEYSSSGGGVHVFGSGTLPPGLRQKFTEPDGTGVELYADGRAMCFGITGYAWGRADTQTLPPAWAMRERTSAADSALPDTPGPVSWYGYTGTDDEIITRIANDKRVAPGALLGVGGAAITPAQLWAGDAAAIIAKWPDAGKADRTDHGRCSEADLALANIVARACGGDTARMSRIMWRSGLVREKWTTNRGKLSRAVRKAAAWIWSGDGHCWNDTRVAPAVAVPELPANPGVLDAVSGLDHARALIRDAGSLTELLKTIAPRIAEMGLDRGELEILAADMRQRSDRLNDKLPLATIREALSPSPAATGSPEWLADWAYIADVDAFYYRPSGQVLKRQAADSMMRENDLPRGKTGKPISPMELFFDVWRGNTAHMLLYSPGEPKYYDHACGGRIANSFNFDTLPVADSAIPGNLATLSSLHIIERHIRMLCNNREREYRLLMGWLAHTVLRPGKKIPWAPIIQGVQGSGKSFFGAIVRKCLGDVFVPGNNTIQPRGHVRVVQPSDLANSGGFTDWANGRAVTIFEEIYIQGGSKWALTNIVKPYISEHIVSLNRKGSVGSFDIPNRTNYIAFTNHRDAVPLEASDRRWFVLFATLLDALVTADSAYMDTVYFPALWNALVSGVTAGTLLAWLQPWLAVTLPHRAPHTAEKQSMMVASESDITEIIRDAIGGRGVVSLQECEVAALMSGNKYGKREIRRAIEDCGLQRWMGGDRGRTREHDRAPWQTLFVSPAFAEYRQAKPLLLEKNRLNNNGSA